MSLHIIMAGVSSCKTDLVYRFPHKQNIVHLKRPVLSCFSKRNQHHVVIVQAHCSSRTLQFTGRIYNGVKITCACWEHFCGWRITTSVLLWPQGGIKTLLCHVAYFNIVSDCASTKPLCSLFWVHPPKWHYKVLFYWCRPSCIACLCNMSFYTFGIWSSAADVSCEGMPRKTCLNTF